MKLKVAYTIPELAAMAGTSTWRMRKLLTSNGVKLHKTGVRRPMVLLSQIRRSFPDLWDSILDRIRMVEK